jgi:general stress protein YciG
MSKKPKKNPIAVKIGKAGGLARAKALTPEQRSAIARKGGIARMRGSKS